MGIMHKLPRLAGFTLLLGLVTGLIWFIFIRDDSSVPSNVMPSPVVIPVENMEKQAHSLVIGKISAPVTITKYGDFLCPICKRFFETTEPQLIAKYVDTGRVKIVFKVDTHIAEQSQYAGEGAYCAAEQGKFRDYHDFVYRIQCEYDGYSFDRFKTLVRDQLELDRNNFDTCMDGHRYQSKVEADHTESGRVGKHTTPTFLIGEHKISGAQPLSIFDTVLRTAQ
jgi:protein-disulfide isomerase